MGMTLVSSVPSPLLGSVQNIKASAQTPRPAAPRASALYGQVHRAHQCGVTLVLSGQKGPLG